MHKTYAKAADQQSVNAFPVFYVMLPLNARILRTLLLHVDQQNIENINNKNMLQVINKLLFVEENDASL